MTDPDSTGLLAEPAAGFLEGRTLSAEARSISPAGRSLGKYLEALGESDLAIDAEAILAHALPRREAVWWACRCTRLALGDNPTAEVFEALKATEAWATAPLDSNRRKAYHAGEAAGFGHPAGCAALAAFFSGGSLAPPRLPEVKPPPHLTGDCVASSVMLSAVLHDPAAASIAHRTFLAIGLAVAAGQDRWPTNL